MCLKYYNSEWSVNTNTIVIEVFQIHYAIKTLVSKSSFCL